MKVLIGDDCPTTRNVMKRSLVNWDFEPIVESESDRILSHLTDPDGPQIAVLGWNLAGTSGPEVCRKLRAVERDRYAYVVVLSDKEGEEPLVEAMQAGADDYVRKPVSQPELRLRLESGKRIIELEKRLIRSHRKIEVLSTHDILTGVLNRAAVLERLEQELVRSRRKGLSTALMIVHADRLKSINDVDGHDAGDRALVETAKRLQTVVRSYDHLGRWEGSQFLIVLPDTNRHEARHATRRILQALEESEPAERMSWEKLAFNVGVATTEDTGYGMENILTDVENAVERAKRTGTRLQLRSGNGYTNSLTEDLSTATQQ